MAFTRKLAEGVVCCHIKICVGLAAIGLSAGGGGTGRASVLPKCRPATQTRDQWRPLLQQAASCMRGRTIGSSFNCCTAATRGTWFRLGLYLAAKDRHPIQINGFRLCSPRRPRGIPYFRWVLKEWIRTYIRPCTSCLWIWQHNATWNLASFSADCKQGRHCGVLKSLAEGAL